MNGTELWKQAIEEKMNVLNRNYTWEILPKPSDRCVVRSHWVFKIKQKGNNSDKWYKAHLVAKRFYHIPGIDFKETYAPVACYNSLHLLIALAAHNDWDIK